MAEGIAVSGNVGVRVWGPQDGRYGVSVSIPEHQTFRDVFESLRDADEWARDVLVAHGGLTYGEAWSVLSSAVDRLTDATYNGR